MTGIAPMRTAVPAAIIHRRIFSRSLEPADGGSEDVPIAAVIIPKLELSNIERQIFPAYFMKRADHATFEDRPEAFNRVRMNRADDVLARGMVDATVRVVAIQPVVGVAL